MASFFYCKIAPDFSDLDNSSGQKPGYMFQVAEKDGGIILTLSDADKPTATKNEEFKGIFVGFTEAEQIVTELQNAIAQAKTKGTDQHSGRVREP